MTESDDRIVQEFLLESYENLDRMARDLVALESHPGASEALSSVFRTVHTLKGTCGFLGFGKLEAVAHRGETLLGRLRDGELSMTPEIADVLLALVDAVREMLASIERVGHEGERDDAALIEALERAQGYAGAAASPETAAPDSTLPEPASRATDAQGIAAEKRLFDDMIAGGRLDPEQAQIAAHQQALGDPRRLGEILVDNGALQPHEVLEALVTRPGGTPPPALRSTIRVDVAVLERLVNQVGELVQTRNQILQFAAANDAAALPTVSQRLDEITTELQEAVMAARMQPIQSLWDALPRLVRDVAAACGKQVRLEIEGGDTELDKTLLEAIRDPLVHLVRNAIDHGIESPAARTQAGKPPQGCLRVTAFHRGGLVHVEVADDGAGISVERIRRRALERGRVSPDRAVGMRDQDWVALIFEPGFSTAQRITTLSGRGVGMDVVRTNLERIGGSLEVESRPGAGTTIHLRIPLTLAIIPALCIASGGEEYAIPQGHLLEVVRAASGEDRPAGPATASPAGAPAALPPVEWVQDSPVLRLRGRLLPLVSLAQALGQTDRGRAAAAPPDSRRALPIVVLHADGGRFGLVVDEVRDTREIVVKPLTRLLRHVSLFAGATVTGDGRVSLILDAQSLACLAARVVQPTAPPAASGPEAAAGLAVPARALLLVEVDEGRRAAIPLADIARIEEAHRPQIERVSDRWAMQYQGGVLPLVPIARLIGAPAPGSLVPPDEARVVMVPVEGRNVGLVVERVLDVVEAPVTLSQPALHAGVPGTAVLEGQLTEILDGQALVRLARARDLVLETA